MSVDAIKKFLEDTQGSPDSTPVKIGDTEIPLGSLRALNSTERQTLSDRMKQAEAKEAELNKRQETIVDLAQKAQAAYQAAEEAKAKAGQRQPDPSADPFNDPWLMPVKTRFESSDKKLESIENQNKQLFQVISRIAELYTKREGRREYESLNFGKREKKPTYDDIVKYATENKIVDSDGVISVRGAWDKMSEADRLEDARKEALEKGREEGRMEAMASRFTAPGVSGAGQGPAAPKKITPDTDILGDLYGDALKDPDIRALLEQTGAA